jgi:prepilin-type N-terminal cleavage/methylation domain-containing protein
MMTPSRGQRLLGGKAFSEGFSLLELLVAMAVFLIVSAVSFTLFSRHEALLSQEQGMAGLNIGLRNALAQIQLDVANAGNGLILGTNVPAWPVGVTIQNSIPTTAQCNPAASYPPVYATACFDQLSVIVVDPNTPAIHPCITTGCSISTSSGNSLYGQPSSPYTASQIAGNFHIGDQVLFVQSCSGGGHATGSSGCMFTTAILTAAGTTSTTPPGCSPLGCVYLSFNSTLTPGVPPPPYPGSNNAANDPLGMTTNAPAADLTNSFGPQDWVVRLLPISYSVNTNNPNDPQLIRTQAGTQTAVMDQVIGFKVGAALWNNSNTSLFQYNYNTLTYSTPNEFNLIRSVRVSIIGRTQPDPTNPYRNAFDSGPYQIRGNSIIVDPRNLTMNSD